jgi:hypothetical protein
VARGHPQRGQPEHCEDELQHGQVGAVLLALVACPTWYGIHCA